MRNEVFEIVSQIMNVPIDRLDDDTSPGTISVWDSLKHMNLILALEEKFAVSFSDDEIVSMLSIKSILELLSKKQASDGAMP
jgi:acyl carrier protein